MNIASEVLSFRRGAVAQRWKRASRYRSMSRGSKARPRLGLALGGGGARGAAHLGILRALEKADIAVDLIAGSSMGSLVGLAYAFGYSPDEILDLIVREMAAPRAWRMLPGGGLGHMAWMYRSGGYRRKAQRVFPNSTFEQLRLPLYLVAADLVSGQEIIHESGDAVAALMESINFPGMASPILRDGKVIVDGGVLNNVPTSVLRERGADVVIAADVAFQIEPRFGRYDPDLPADNLPCPSAMETLLRVIQVQQRALINARAAADEIIITPEVKSFGFTDYHRAHEMADIGEAAAEAALPALRQMLAA
jgi:predicted acylesterase/phospholipase RssA